MHGVEWNLKMSVPLRTTAPTQFTCGACHAAAAAAAAGGGGGGGGGIMMLPTIIR